MIARWKSDGRDFFHPFCIEEAFYDSLETLIFNMSKLSVQGRKMLTTQVASPLGGCLLIVNSPGFADRTG